MKAEEIAKLIDGKVIGSPTLQVEGITNMENPLKGHIAFIQDEKGLKKMEASEIECLIVPRSIQKSEKTIIQTENPKLAWAKLLNEFFPARKYAPGVSDQASISPISNIGKNVTIEAFVFVSDGAVVGDNTVLRTGVSIGKNAKVGENCIFHPHVVIYDGCEVGSRVILHAGAVIGSDGFGYVGSAQGHAKVPQVGNVVIEDDVEIGASSTVDCATVGSTRIGQGCKIDNQVQIAHNVLIGPCTVISAQTGISGSSKIGAFVTMGGKVGCGDHVEIGDQVMVGAGAGLPSGKKVPPQLVIFGEPARPYPVARKQIAAQLKSAETRQEVRKLRKEVDELKKK